MGRTACLEPLQQIETASIDELRDLQLRRLQWSLQHSYQNSPVYRQKFDAHGIHPEDLQPCPTCPVFPSPPNRTCATITPFGIFACPMADVVRLHASSGTTGKPTVVGYTAADIDTWAGLVARSIRAAGGSAADKVHIAYGYGLFTGGLGAHYGAERLGCTVIPMSGGQTEKQVQLLCDFDPDIIMVTPSYMLNIADEMARQGVDPARLALRVGIFGAEPWTDAMRLQLEQRLAIDATDIYGLSEVMGPGVAQECVESKDGPTVWEDHFYPEIVNPETGASLPDGEIGELVFTSLSKEAMPVIRYRTRDLTRLLPGTARTMRRMDKITGRCDDMLIIRGVNVFPSQIEEQLLRIAVLSPHYYLLVDKAGHLDRLTVHVELVADAAPADKPTASAALTHQIKTLIGVSAAVEVHDSGTIPRSEGKARRVIDQRP